MSDQPDAPRTADELTRLCLLEDMIRILTDAGVEHDQGMRTAAAAMLLGQPVHLTDPDRSKTTDWEELQERLYWLSQPGIHADLAVSAHQDAATFGIPHLQDLDFHAEITPAGNITISDASLLATITPEALTALLGAFKERRLHAPTAAHLHAAAALGQVVRARAMTQTAANDVLSAHRHATSTAAHVGADVRVQG